MIYEFNDSNFEKNGIEASKTKPVLVDFFAQWCGPCKMQAPIMEEVAKEAGEKALVGKLDTEEAPLTAERFNIMSIPTLILFKDGEAKEVLSGLQPKETLMEIINKYI